MFRVAPRLPAQVLTVTTVDVAGVPQPTRVSLSWHCERTCTATSTTPSTSGRC